MECADACLTQLCYRRAFHGWRAWARVRVSRTTRHASMDKLARMRAFTKVVANGSFSAAARELRLSRSAVSKYVIDLEAELGVQLLNRTTRSASPTDNGRLYYDRCVAILADIEEADDAVAHLQAAPRGILK